jgi:hypothetical protein
MRDESKPSTYEAVDSFSLLAFDLAFDFDVLLCDVGRRSSPGSSDADIVDTGPKQKSDAAVIIIHCRLEISESQE